MITAVLRRLKRNTELDDGWIEAGEATVRVLRAGPQPTVAVSGRVTTDSSPRVRSVLLALLRRGAGPVLVIDLSGVSYIDTSGIATLLEALKIARNRSVRLRLTGLSGQARMLAELTKLEEIIRASGSEVEFS